MYTIEETEVLINAQSSKTMEVEERLSPLDYPTYNDEDEVNQLIKVEPVNGRDDVDTTRCLDSHTWTTWEEYEVYSLLENEYDPRNFGNVQGFKGNYRNKHERDI